MDTKHRKYEPSAIQPVIVASSLSELDGPTTGVVELPGRIDWTPANKYELDIPKRVQTMYRTVLQQARGVEDLRFLNAVVLQSIWPGLQLPARIREAWEVAFPELVVAH
jgi:hypothetical protein